MTICSKTLEAVRERLEERKSLEEIGRELCDAVDDHKGKALRLVKKLKGKDADQFLKDNADWLGIDKAKMQGAKTKELNKKLVDKKNFVSNNIASPLTISVASVALTVSDTTVSSERAYIVDKTPKIETPKIETPKIETEIVPKKELPKPEYKQPKIIESVCIIGKNIPNCDKCKYGECYEINNEWGCNQDYFNCTSKICYFDNEMICDICTFKTRHKDVYFAHVSELHSDRKDYIKNAGGKILWDEIRRSLVICPCGCGFGYKNSFEFKDRKWYSKDELDEFRKL